MLYSDGHCHLAASKELAQLQQTQGVLTIINCEDPAEYALNQTLIDPKIQTLSFGIHPWKADQIKFEAVQSFLAQAEVIGEIGLDSEWTEVDLAIQRPIFEAQLAFAAKVKKPVVLHTKGCEAEILTYLKKYPNRYLVHWYSANDFQADYIALGCYFTIGVDVKTDSAVQKLAQQVPADRLLVETDGLAAVEWALDQSASVDDYLTVLTTSCEKIATLRKTTSEEIQQLAYQNLKTFLNK